MGAEQNWRPETNAIDFFGQQKKRQALADRRPVIRRAADLVGPGIGPQATRITDFNDLLATFNGFFSAKADPALLNSPGNTDSYVGTVVSDAELGGVQTFTSLTTGDTYQRVFTRNPADASTLYWDNWVKIIDVP